MGSRVTLADVDRYVESLSTDREAAFFGLPETICGIDVVQLTPYRFGILCGSGNAIVNDGDRTDAEILAFLWVVSTEFTRDRKARDSFILRNAKLDFGQALIEIAKYLSETFRDREDWESDKAPSYPTFSFLAGITDMLASEYGWQLDQCINTPYKVIYQLRKAIRNRKEDKPTFLNPWDMMVQKAVNPKLFEEAHGA